MPNMSYCRFENTAKDFQDCLNVVGDALDTGLNYKEFLEKLGDDEAYWFKRLMTYCSDMTQYVDVLHENQKQDEY